jgi:outer membrane protein assembly factor BamB
MFYQLCVYISILSVFSRVAESRNIVENSTAYYFSWPQKWHDAAHTSAVTQGIVSHLLQPIYRQGTGTPIWNVPTLLWSIEQVGVFPDFVSDTDDQAVIDSKLGFYKYKFFLISGFIYVKRGMQLRKVNIDGHTQLWSTSLPNDYAFGSNPVIDENQQMVYVYTSNINGLLMAAFDLQTGEFLWLQPGDKPIATLGTETLFLGSNQRLVPSGSPVVHPNGLILLVGYPLYDGMSYVIAINPIHKYIFNLKFQVDVV